MRKKTMKTNPNIMEEIKTVQEDTISTWEKTISEQKKAIATWKKTIAIREDTIKRMRRTNRIWIAVCIINGVSILLGIAAIVIKLCFR